MRHSSFLRIDLENVLKALILLGYSILFIVLIVTRKISQYLHPRMIPYMIFAVVAFLLMIYALIQDLKKKSRRFSLGPCLLFLLPLILALTVPAAAMNSSSLQFSNTSIGAPTLGTDTVSGGNTNQTQAPVNNSSGVQSDSVPAQSTDSSGDPISSQDQATASDNYDLHLQPNQTAVYTKTPFGSTVVLIITDNTITLDNSNFVNWISTLDNDPAKYKGMKIEYTGYVYKSGDFGTDQFVAARDMMWCCAADLQLIGCLCQYDKASELEDNSWVKINGTLSTTTWKGAVTPLIVDASVVPAQKPANDYVYASY
jgi:putative membrane protein